jgi:hypothetical protein
MQGMPLDKDESYSYNKTEHDAGLTRLLSHSLSKLQLVRLNSVSFVLGTAAVSNWEMPSLGSQSLNANTHREIQTQEETHTELLQRMV